MSLKILHCIHALHGGGAERQLTILANHLDGSGLEFVIFCVDDSINDINNQHCEVRTLKDKKNYPWHMIKETTLAIERDKPDLIHCWLPPSISAPALIAAKMKNIPAVASYRNKKIFESWIRIPEYISTLFCANSIVSNNPPGQSSFLFRQLFSQKGGVVIPNAVAVPDCFRQQREDRPTNNVFKMLFVGRITQQKNWPTLLRALSLMGKDTKWELLVCGKGEDEKDFQALSSQLGISNKIQMLGYRSDVYAFMAEADLLILPSWYEGMPNVILESLSIGVPAVVSSIEAHQLLFDDNSGVCFFDPNSDQQLASTLNDIVNKSINMEQLSSQGLAFVKAFTPEILLARYYAYYSEILTKYYSG